MSRSAPCARARMRLAHPRETDQEAVERTRQDLEQARQEAEAIRKILIRARTQGDASEIAATRIVYDVSELSLQEAIAAHRVALTKMLVA